MKRIFLISTSRVIAVAIFLSLLFANHAFSKDDVNKVTFYSINQSNHRLYAISEILLYTAFRNLGVKFEMKEYPSNRIPMELNCGKADGDTHRIYDFNRDNQYPNLIRVDEWTLKVEQSVFTKLNNLRVNGWGSLLPYKIIYINGIKAIENGLEKANFPKQNRIGVYDIDTAFKLLDLGRGDIVVVSPSTGKISLEKLGLIQSGIKMLKPALITIKLYPYMNKKHSVLAKKLAIELKKMKASGEYDKLLSLIPE